MKVVSDIATKAERAAFVACEALLAWPLLAAFL